MQSQKEELRIGWTESWRKEMNQELSTRERRVCITARINFLFNSSGH